ncbi:MAG: hypothetical protein ACK4UO_00425 [Pseudolabrys sp.]
MRIAMLALVALVGLTAQAAAQTRILTVPEPERTQSIPPPAAEQVPTPSESANPVTETPPPAPLASPAPPPARSAEPVPPPPAAAGRYGFNRVDGGLLRLDTQTGQVAFCSAGGAGWACQVVPEDRAAFEQEIARLQDEVVALKKEVAALREPPPPRPPAEFAPPPPPPPAADKDNEVTIKLPTQEDIDRASAAIHDAWRRLVDMLVTFKNDMMRKG